MFVLMTSSDVNKNSLSFMANFILCQIIAVFVFVFVFPKRTKHISCFEIILLLNVSPHSCNQRLQEKTGLEKKKRNVEFKWSDADCMPAL